MQYLNQTFSVFSPGTDEYRRNWESIFGTSSVSKVAKSSDATGEAAAVEEVDHTTKKGASTRRPRK